MRVLVVGHGIVGEEMERRFEGHCDIVDPLKPGVERYTNGAPYAAAFICVPTPPGENGECDTSLVVDAVRDTASRFLPRVICIKSTVAPGFTEAFARTIRIPLVFSPEFSGITRHVLHDENFTIIGGKRKARQLLADVFLDVVAADHRIMFTDATTAELCKYMVNSFLATKVTFCNEFARIAAAHGVSYEELRQLFVCDPRVGASHTIVFEDAPFYQSKCFDKDLPAILYSAFGHGLYDVTLLDAVVKTNARFRSEYEGE